MNMKWWLHPGANETAGMVAQSPDAPAALCNVPRGYPTSPDAGVGGQLARVGERFLSSNTAA